MKNIRTFVISMAETPLRTKYILDQCKLQNINAELFEAVNGQKLELTTTISNKLEYPDREIKIIGGDIGCFLSHFTLWKLLLYLPQEEFLILEDDCVFCDKFEETFDKLYDRLPSDWEMVYVGWNINDFLVKCGYDIVQSVITEGISIRIPSNTHAYIIKKEALPKLINSVYPMTSPIDLQLIDKALPQLKYYVFDPSLINQKTFRNFSDPQWISSSYDWELDIYKLKRKLIKKVKFLNGWYQEERNQNSIWRWSKDTFTIEIPSYYKIKMKFSSAIPNLITLMSDPEHFQKYSVLAGDSEIEFGIDRETPSIQGKVEIPYVPSKEDSNNNDNRILGICLKDIEIKIDDNQWIPIKIANIPRSF